MTRRIAELVSAPPMAVDPLLDAAAEAIRNAMADSCVIRIAGEDRSRIDQVTEPAKLVVPMRARGMQVGVMTLVRSAPRPAFDERDALLVQDIADHLGLAVHATDLQDQINILSRTKDVAEPADEGLATLTARQREIFRQIGEGFSSREIGGRLFLSVRTVEWHRARLMTRLGVASRSELIARGRALRP